MTSIYPNLPDTQRPVLYVVRKSPARYLVTLRSRTSDPDTIVGFAPALNAALELATKLGGPAALIRIRNPS